MKFFSPDEPHETLPTVRPPKGEKCFHCDEPIRENECGFTMKHLSRGHKDGSHIQDIYLHYECQIRQMAGSVAHQQGRCGCKFSSPWDEDGDAKEYRSIRAAAKAATEVWEKGSYVKELP